MTYVLFHSRFQLSKKRKRAGDDGKKEKVGGGGGGRGLASSLSPSHRPPCALFFFPSPYPLPIPH